MTCIIIICVIFQSTLSVRRATHVAVVNNMTIEISIHALREESDIIRYGTSALSN